MRKVHVATDAQKRVHPEIQHKTAFFYQRFSLYASRLCTFILRPIITFLQAFITFSRIIFCKYDTAEGLNLPPSIYYLFDSSSNLNTWITSTSGQQNTAVPSG